MENLKRSWWIIALILALAYASQFLPRNDGHFEADGGSVQWVQDDAAD